MENKSKKKYLIGALAVLLVAVCVGGTIAWLNSQSQKTNSFTVGSINNPTTPPGGGEDGDGSISGNLDEPSWVDNSKITPGTSVSKDPYVGLGKGSESAYVFVYIDNNTMSEDGKESADAPYFTLNPGWAATMQTNAAEEIQNAYTGGLFMYSADGTNPTLLPAYADKDSWTSNPVFSTVTTPKAAEASDFADEPKIEVYSYVVVANSPQEALTAAVQWANHPTGPTTNVQP